MGGSADPKPQQSTRPEDVTPDDTQRFDDGDDGGPDLLGQLGLVPIEERQKVLDAANDFLASKGFDSNSAWVESYRYGVLRVAAVASAYKFLRYDREALREAVAEACGVDVEVILGQRRKR